MRAGTAGATSGFELELLSPDELAGNPDPDLPLRLWIQGEFTVPHKAAVSARFHIRFGLAQFSHLCGQLCAAQVRLTRANQHEAEIRAQASVVLLSGPPAEPGSPEYRELIRRVHDGLAATLEHESPMDPGGAPWSVEPRREGAFPLRE
ncbi:hypothetical protein ACVWXU_005656 [Streptomyces sp. TE33382]